MVTRVRRRRRNSAHRIITFTVVFVSYSIFQAVYSSEAEKMKIPKEVVPTIFDMDVLEAITTLKPRDSTANEKEVENADKTTEASVLTVKTTASTNASEVVAINGTTPTALENGTTPGSVHPTYRPKRVNCTPPAIEQFPRPLMGPGARRHGGLLIHVLVAIFTFIGLAIVCDDYFVGSLDRICEELKLAPDVAGATFMAAGSSAPELATVVIGVFFAKDDIGISGVIGSAVFNIMFVISVCALFAGTVSHLNWWPMVRDCFFYALSILVMLITIANDYVSWPEALFMLIMYAVYCVVLHFNTPLERWAYSLNLPIKLPTKDEQAALVTYKVAGNVSAAKPSDGDLYDKMDGDTSDKPQSGYNTQTEAYENAGYNDEHQQAAAWDPNQTWGNSGQAAEQPVWDPNNSWDSPAPAAPPPSNHPQSPPQQKVQTPQAVAQVPPSSAPTYYKAKEYNADTDINPLEKPSNPSVYQLVNWYICYPIHWVCRHTMPDCRSRFYVITFIMSMFWISFFSYFMVWMITIIGSTLGIPDTVMGLTFVAAGVSVPDALSSLAVIKEGYGDMAVSNAVGSNVFDILVCLGLPWLIQTSIIKPGSHVNVTSKGLFYSTFSLLSTVIFLLVATHFNGWKLDRKYGIILMIWYLLFITFASLYELNFFGNLHPPECPSLY